MNASTLAEILSRQAHFTRHVVNANLEGVDPADHFRAPDGGGNCLNWVLGHLVHSRNGWLGLLGQEPVIEADRTERYRRGSVAVNDPADSVPSEDLLAAFNRSQDGLLAGLKALTDERLAEKAPASPGNDPDETVGSLLTLLAFHEAYHAGQLGVIRRSLGLEGAIR